MKKSFHRILSTVIIILVAVFGIFPQSSAYAAPNVSVTKTTSGLHPTGVADQYEIIYYIVVTNTGTNPAGTYGLTDTPRFGTGVNIISASYRKNGGAITALAGTGPWTLQAAGTSIGAGIVEFFELTVIVNPTAAAGLALNCIIDGGETTNTGMRNQADLTGSTTATVYACDPISNAGVMITTFQTSVPLDSNKSCQPVQEGPDAMFYEVEIYNPPGGGTVNNLTITMANFTAASANPGGFVGTTALDTGETGVRTIQSIADGTTKHLFYYVTYPCYNGSYTKPPDWTWNFNITVTDGVSSYAYARSLTTRNESSAAVALIDSTDLGLGTYLGQVIPYTVVFQLKNIGANQDVYLQPAGNIELDSSCYRLMGDDVTAVSGAGFTGITTANDNDIYFRNVSTSGSANYVTVTYYFLVTCGSNASSSAFPFTDIGSGNIYKYSGADGTCGTAQCETTWPAVTNPPTITKTTLDPVLPIGGTARFIVTVTNNGTQPIYIDSIRDDLPSGETLNNPFADGEAWCTGTTRVTASKTFSSPTGGTVGPATLNWVANQVGVVPPVTGEYQIPASGTLTLCYTADVQNTPGTYTNSATAIASGTTIGPATATVTVGAPDLTVTKTNNGPVTVGSPFTWTLTVNGGGNAAAVFNTNNVILTDNLPSGPTYGAVTVTPVSGITGNVACSITTNVLTCTASGGSVTIATTGSFTVSFPVTPNAAGSLVNPTGGTCSVDPNGLVVESNEGNNNCNNTATVNLASPTIATTPSAGGVVGITLNDTATLTGGYNPTGPVTFRLFPPSDPTCAGAASYTDVDNTAPYATTGGFATNAVGTWHWTASYAGDANNNPATSGCAAEPVTVSPATPTLTTVASGPVTVGANITDTATLGGGYGTLGGTISFNVYAPGDTTCATPIAVNPAVAVNGTGSYTSAVYATTAAGTYRWIASYSGDANNNAVTGTCNDAGETSTVNKASPTISTVPSAGGVVGVTLNDTATLSGGYSPAGSVTFRLFPPTDPTCSGAALYTDVDAAAPYATSPGFAATSAGTWYWTADYAGDTNNNGATSACMAEQVTVTKATPTLTTTASGPVTVGANITDTANLSGGFGTLTGTISFNVYAPGDTTCATPIAVNPAVTANGTGNYTSANYATTTPGSYRWIASYTGDANNNGVTGVCNAANETSTVNQATPTVVTAIHAGSDHVTSVTSVSLGTTVHDSAVVSGGAGTPTGTVTFSFFNNGTCAAPAAASSSAFTLSGGSYDATTFTQTPAATGDYSFQAAYSGDTNYTGGTSACEPLTVAGTASISLVKTGTLNLGANGRADAGDTITYTFTVTNTGTLTLTNVTVTDPKVTVVGGPLASLAPGASDTTTFSGTYTLTQADIDSGTFTNTATATGTPPSGPNVTGPGTDTKTLPPDPAITLIKNGTLNDGGDGQADAGDTITYTFTVTNTGNVTLTNVTVTDPLVTVVGGPITLLPGASDTTTFTATYTLTQADIDSGAFENVATAGGNPPTGPRVTGPGRNRRVLPAAPAIALVKTGTLNPGANGRADAGDTITYTFTVTNTGNVTLANVRVTDPKVTVLGGPVASLAPGASDTTTFTGTYTLTQADIDSGTFTNTATATGTPPAGPDVSGPGTDTKTLTAAPALTIVKSTNGQDANAIPGPVIAVGAAVNWSYLVTNTGNVTLTNLVVTDDQGVTVTCPQTTLAPTASMTCTASGTAVAGQYTNNGTASTTYGGNPVNASDVSHYFGTLASISLAKSTTTPLVVSGSNVTFTLTVTNPGNVTLTNIIINDPTCNTLTGPAGDTNGNSSLETTETWTYTCTVNNVTANLTNNASVTGTPPIGPDVTSNASASVTVINPAIAITKTPPTQNVISGSNATFTLTVTNPGNVALSNVVVTDVLCSTLSAKSGDTNSNNILETTETWTYTCTVNNVTANFTNSADVSGDPPVGTPVTGNATADVTVTAILPPSIAKAFGAASIPLNGITSLTFTITNPNTLTALTGVAFTDNLPPFMLVATPSGLSGSCGGGTITAVAGSGAVSLSGATLAPSASCTFSVNVTGTMVAFMSNWTNPVTSTNGGTGNQANATLRVVADPSLSKVLVADSLAATVNPQATIGEIVAYDVTITVPANATMTNAQLTDTFGHGLAFYDCQNITVNGQISTSAAGGFAGVCNAPTVSNVGSDPTDAGRVATFNFGTLANSSGIDGTVVVRVRAVVLNIAGVVRGTTLTNNAGLTWDGGSLTASDPTLTVTEPTLNIVKTANITTAMPGTVITFTLTATYVGTGSPAYDAYLTDTIPAGLTYVPGSFIFVSGQAPVLTDAAAPNLRADWTIYNNTGTPTVLQYQATLGNLPGGQTLNNTANLAWSSLPGPVTEPQSTYNVNSVERNYDPGSPINIYDASSTMSITVAGGVTAALPATGFAADRVTVLPSQPADFSYGSLGTLWLEVPKLGVQVSIVGVPLKDNKWDLTWLSNQAGYLQGTAFPTWNGNSAITAHVYLSDGKPGPFVSLNTLKWGDEVIVHAFGKRYVYQVRDNQRVTPSDMSVFKHEEKPWVTLITCQGYNETTGKYQYRVAVRAVLIRVDPEKSTTANSK